MKIFRNRTVIGVLCILLALVICFGVTPLFSRSASEKAEIVRVTADIKEGDEITAEMVQTVEVGAYCQARLGQTLEECCADYLAEQSQGVPRDADVAPYRPL